MDLPRVITDSWKRVVGNEPAAAGASAGAPRNASVDLVALWRDAVADRRANPAEVEPEVLARAGALERRLEEPRGDGALLADLVDSLRELTLPPLARMRERVDDLSKGSRSHQRAASAHELKLTHLKDEIARCRAVIEQESRRRGLHLTSKPLEDDNLHDLLFQVFKAISHAGSRRMQAVGSDPVLVEIDRLIQSEDPAAIDAFPAWLRKPAARVLALVQERNRYKRTLANRGLLPPE
jgi:hypothetical protein